MPRRSRESLHTSFFHVIVQGVNKEFIFKKDKYKRKYLNLLKKGKIQAEIDIVAYAIMYNHAHLLLHTDNAKKLSSFMKKINEDYARYYNHIENRVGHVFRDRFLSEPIINQKYLLNCISYIHNNPVKANIVKNCEDYKFSSYSNYIRREEFIDKNIIELVFGSKVLDLEQFRAMHVKNKYYFAEYDDMLQENMKEILIDLEERYGKKTVELVKNPVYLENIVVEIKDRIKISNIKLAQYLQVNRNKIYRVLK